MENLVIKILVFSGEKEFWCNIYNSTETSTALVNFQYDFRTDIMIEKKEFDTYALCIVLARKNDCDKNIELCKRYRKLTDKPLLILGKSDTRMAVDFLKSGADDYIRMPIPKNTFETLLYAHYRRECRKKR